MTTMKKATPAIHSTRKDDTWMRKAFAGSHGQFHRQLGIPNGTPIPKDLLKALMATKTNHLCRNPTKEGHRFILVTKLVHERANLLLNSKK